MKPLQSLKKTWKFLHYFILGSSLFLFFPGLLEAQKTFNKGVNLSNWFQASSVNDIQFNKYSRKDIVNIKSLGCDVIRLPINLHSFTSGSPDYIINPVFYNMLDSAVSWAEDLDINLILDNHSFDPSINTDPTVGDILVKVWTQMAEHYKSRSTLIKYEILNEPHGITTAVWSSIQQTVLNSIRAVDNKHSIIVGASNYNTYNELSQLPVYSDTNLIYTFHFYDPFVFTHEGATWVSPSMIDLAGVPFPYNAATMPACPASLKGSWLENEVKYNYPINGNVAKVKQLLDIAINFRNTRKVPVYCGEFGVYNLNSIDSDRVAWYEAVRTYLESNGISWTTWDYQGGFGLFKKNSNEFFEHDLNVPLLKALGLNVPSQTVYVQRPDSIGFPIYSDYIEKDIIGSNGSTGIDYYGSIHPNNGNYCIDWKGSAQYSYIGFDFIPNKDLSELVKNNYAIDFFVRGDSPGSNFEIRFIDTKTSNPNDHPWRMHMPIGENYGPWDKKWHHVRIPLKDFTEMGSWDNGTWYNPDGLYDWTATDRFDIVAESEDLSGKEFWFDNILITDIDSSLIWDNTVLKTAIFSGNDKSARLLIYPNPVKSYLIVAYLQYKPGDVFIRFYDSLGREIFSEILKNQTAGNHEYSWNIKEAQLSDLRPGMYILNIGLPGDSGLSGNFIIE